MQVNFEKIEDNKVKLTITVEKEKFNEALDYSFKKVSKDVTVPGFRKGKVPRNIFEKKFGEEALYEEAINYIIPKVYPDAVEEAKLDPVAQPTVDFDYDTIGKDQDFTFTAIVVVRPEVKLGTYKGIEVKPLEKEVTEDDINAEIKKLLDQHAELVVKETEAQLGDTVVIDYEGFKDDVPFEGGKAENYSLTLGSNSFIPGFEDQLVGIKANEERTINLTFPEEYHSEELKGANARFDVKCHEVKERMVPELDDEIVKELNKENINTAEELKNDIKTRLQTQKEEAAKNYVIDTVVDTASNNAEINVPVEMIQAETEQMMQDADNRLKQQGLNLDLYLQYTGSSREALYEQLKGDAEKRIRYNLTLAQIAEVENIKPTEEEIAQELEKIAQAYNVTLEQVKAAFPDTHEIEQDLKVKKAVDFLVENSKEI